MDYKEYMTKDGDRWDYISYIHYSVPDKYHVIQLANEDTIPVDILYRPILPAGLILKIPDIQPVINKLPIPPWK